MPKSVLPFNPNEYALVADRITLFYERFPTGRIITELVSRERDVLFKASVFREANDAHPAATGWASEREGDGDIFNAVACVENTETSAIGRALANLGFTASRKRPSREEMEKAERRRTVLYGSSGRAVNTARVAEAVPEAAPTLGDSARDLAELFIEAKSLGMSPDELERVEQRMTNPATPRAELDSLRRRLRRWILNRQPSPHAADPPLSPEPVNTPR